MTDKNPDESLEVCRTLVMSLMTEHYGRINERTVEVGMGVHLFVDTEMVEWVAKYIWEEELIDLLIGSTLEVLIRYMYDALTVWQKEHS